VLWRIFGPKWEEVTGSGEDYIRRNFVLCTPLQISLGLSNQKTEMGSHEARMRKKRSAYKILVGKPEGRRQLEARSVDESIILKWILETWGGGHGLD
jgi:hypothetical protein